MTGFTTPGYTLNEYKLVMPFPEALENKIRKLRAEFGESYRFDADKSRPHLALVRFTQMSMMEERIVQKLRALTLGELPFKMEMKDFGSFPSHTIYMRISSREPVRKLMRSLREIQKLLRTDNDHKAYFISEPVVPLAGKLKPWQYEKGWLEYSQRQFTGRFIADGLLLLKRTGAHGPWQILTRLSFDGLPVNARQQALF